MASLGFLLPPAPPAPPFLNRLSEEAPKEAIFFWRSAARAAFCRVVCASVHAAISCRYWVRLPSPRYLYMQNPQGDGNCRANAGAGAAGAGVPPCVSVVVIVVRVGDCPDVHSETLVAQVGAWRSRGGSGGTPGEVLFDVRVGSAAAATDADVATLVLRSTQALPQSTVALVFRGNTTVVHPASTSFQKWVRAFTGSDRLIWACGATALPATEMPWWWTVAADDRTSAQLLPGWSALCGTAGTLRKVLGPLVGTHMGTILHARLRQDVYLDPNPALVVVGFGEVAVKGKGSASRYLPVPRARVRGWIFRKTLAANPAGVVSFFVTLGLLVVIGVLSVVMVVKRTRAASGAAHIPQVPVQVGSVSVSAPSTPGPDPDPDPVPAPAPPLVTPAVPVEVVAPLQTPVFEVDVVDGAAPS